MSSGLRDLLAVAPGGLTRGQLCARVPFSGVDPAFVDRLLELPPGTFARAAAGSEIPDAADVVLATWLQRFVVELDAEPWWVWPYGVDASERRGPDDNGLRIWVRCRCGGAFTGGARANLYVKQVSTRVRCAPWTLPEGDYPLGTVWYTGQHLNCPSCSRGGAFRPAAILLCPDTLRAERPE